MRRTIFTLVVSTLLAPHAVQADPYHGGTGAPIAALQPFSVPCADVLDLRIEPGLFGVPVFCVDTRGTPMPWPLLPIEEFAIDSVLLVIPDVEGALILEGGDRVVLHGVGFETPGSWHTEDGKLELDFDNSRELRVFLDGDWAPLVEARIRSTRDWLTISPVPVPGS